MKQNPIQLIKQTNNKYIFELITKLPNSSITRTITITTQHNLLEIKQSSIPKKLIFFIDEKLNDDTVWVVNDEDNNIKIYNDNETKKNNNKNTNKSINLQSAKKSIPSNKFPLTQSQNNNQQLQNEEHQNQSLKHDFQNQIKELKTKQEEEIAILKMQIQKMQHYLEKKPHIDSKPTDNELHNKLDKIISMLKNDYSKPNTQNQFKKKRRLWKERNFCLIHIYVYAIQMELIEVDETNPQIKTYEAKKIYRKKFRTIKIKTQEDISSWKDSQMNFKFYIHENLKDSDYWEIDDDNNQISFYAVKK